MKISHIHTHFEHFPLSRPYRIAFKTIDAVENGVIELHASNGLVGLGTASPEPFVTLESIKDCRRALQEDNLQWLIGTDPRELTRHCRTLGQHLATTPAARAAVDMALHDLLAQQLDIPLVELLGRAHTGLPTSITIGIKNSLQETLDEAKEYLQRGFRIIKLKLGRSLEEDIEHLRRLREVVGTGVRIRVDPNQAYNAAMVLRFLKATEQLDIEFLEQPLPANDVAGMRTLPSAARAQLAADESLCNEADALDLLHPPACGIFNIKLMKCGGLYPALRIATLADIAGLALMWGCMDESRISISAALHAALSCPATRYLDLDGSLDLARDIVEGGFTLQEGILRTTNAPGLGVRLL